MAPDASLFYAVTCDLPLVPETTLYELPVVPDTCLTLACGSARPQASEVISVHSSPSVEHWRCTLDILSLQHLRQIPLSFLQELVPVPGTCDCPVGPACGTSDRPVGLARGTSDRPVGPACGTGGRPVGPASGTCCCPVGPDMDLWYLTQPPVGPSTHLRYQAPSWYVTPDWYLPPSSGD